MIYNILEIADLHWGAMEYKLQYAQYEYIFSIIKERKGQLDLIVLLGDFWDTRVTLNSATGKGGLNWMEELCTLAVECDVKAIRIIKGTKEHDNSQIESFYRLEKRYPFKVFITNTYEETLPGLHAIYCPEESMPHDEYIEKYKENIAHEFNIGFFHGNFDVIMPQIAIDHAKMEGKLIYEYQYWDYKIDGPMLAGHWHNGETYGKLSYIGTPDRWDFTEYANESLPGVGLLSYDITNRAYFYKRIINPDYQLYKNFIIDTESYDNLDKYQSLIEYIDEYKEELKRSGHRFHFKVRIDITDSKVENEQFINFLRDHYISHSWIKIDTKNKMQKKKKMELKEKKEQNDQLFGFIKSDGLTEAQKIQNFIKIKRDEIVPIEVIMEILDKIKKKE